MAKNYKCQNTRACGEGNWIKSSLRKSYWLRPAEQGVELVGPDGPLNQLTKHVLETALDAEMTEHLGYHTHDPAAR